MAGDGSGIRMQGSQTLHYFAPTSRLLCIVITSRSDDRVVLGAESGLRDSRKANCFDAKFFFVKLFVSATFSQQAKCHSSNEAY